MHWKPDTNSWWWLVVLLGLLFVIYLLWVNYPLPFRTAVTATPQPAETVAAVTVQPLVPAFTRQPAVSADPTATLSLAATPTPASTTQPALTEQAANDLTHPFLLFNRQDTVRFKQDVTQPKNFRQKLFLAQEQYLKKDKSSSLFASAFYSLLTDDPAQLSRARDLLMDTVAEDCWGERGGSCQRSRNAADILGQISLAYDWLYPQLSSADRERVKVRIATEVCRFYEAFTYGGNNTDQGWNNWWMTDYSQNHFHSVTGGMVLGALAVKNDDPPPCLASNEEDQQRIVTNGEILDFGLNKMERNYLLFNRIRDGSYSEGDSYVVAYSEIYPSAMWAVHRLRLLSPDPIEEKRWQMFPLFYLFNSLPGQLWNQLTNHGDYFTSSRQNYWLPKDLHLTATLHQNRLAAWLAEQYYYDKDGQIRIPSDNGVAAANSVLDFIFTDPGLAPQSPTRANLALSYHAQDWEGVFMRSDWTASAVAAAIKTGPPGGHAVYNLARANALGLDEGQEPREFDLNAGHVHADANGIYLYANHSFLLPEMLGYNDKSPWGPYTSSHNTIMVSDEQGRMRGQIQGDAVGGATFGYRPWHQGGEHFWDIETPASEVGIIEHAATPGYDYSLGQATSAYWPELGLKRFHRHLVFVRDPGYLLVVDDLAAASEKTYDWMGHSTGPVTQEGSWLKVNADNDQRLGIAVVSPSSFTFAEPANEWEGISLKNVSSFRHVSAKETMYEWKIRQDCQTCRFITVLVPTSEKLWRQKPTVTKLVDTEQLAAVQVNFEAGVRIDTLAVSLVPGQMLTAGELKFNGRTAVVEKRGAAVQRALLVHGTTLKDGETILIRNLPASSFLEAWYEGAQLFLRSPDPAGVTLLAPGITTVYLQSVDENNVVTTRRVNFIRKGDYITIDVGNA